MAETDPGAALSIKTDEEAQQFLSEAKANYEIIKAITWIAGIIGVVPPFNFFLMGVRIICGAVNTFMQFGVTANMVGVSTYYANKDNWTDPAAYEAAMAKRTESYTSYDSQRWFTEVSKDEQSMSDFEMATGPLIWGIPYWTVTALVATPLLYILAPFTLSLSWWLFWVLFFSAWFADLWNLIGVSGESSNYVDAIL